MKKLILVSLFLVFGLSNTFAQSTESKLAVHAGVPVGDAADADFAIGTDFTYFWTVGGILQAGPMVGYSHFFNSSANEQIGNVDEGDLQFIPVAASGRIELPGFFAGLDLGYAVGLNDDTGGGVYYRPKIGFGLFGFNLIGSYSNISTDGAGISAVTAGLEFGF